MREFFSRLLSRLRRRHTNEAHERARDPIERLLTMEAATANESLTNMARSYLLHLHVEHRRHTRWQTIRRAVLVVVMLSAPFAFYVNQLLPQGWSGAFGNKPIVAVLDIQGVIAPGAPSASADSLLQRLRGLTKRGKVDEIVIRLNSPGGQPTEAARMADIIDAVRQKTGARVTVFAGDTMASAAYIVALRADTIVVSEYSLVGSIGAIIKSWDASELMNKIGIKEHVYASGSLKDMLSPTRSPQGPEKEKALDLVDRISQTFVQDVVRRRADRLRLGVEQLKTGEVWTGSQAVQYGLADRIGTFESSLAQWEDKEIVQLGAGSAPSWLSWAQSQLSWWIWSQAF
jgi:protease-4